LEVNEQSELTSKILKNVIHLILSIKKCQFINQKIIKMSIKVEIID